MYCADILPRPTGKPLGDILLQMRRPADALHAYQDAFKLPPKSLRLDNRRDVGSRTRETVHTVEGLCCVDQERGRTLCSETLMYIFTGRDNKQARKQF